MVKFPSLSVIPEANRSSRPTSLSKILIVLSATGFLVADSMSFPVNMTVEPPATLLGGGSKTRIVFVGSNITGGIAKIVWISEDGKTIAVQCPSALVI